MKPPLALALAMALPACAGPETGPYVPGGGVIPLEPRLASISAVILVPRCASSACHGGTGSVPIDLTTPQAALAGMVNAPSTQTDELLVVAPFAPEQSYLMLRLRGLQAGADTMPPSWGGEPLSDEEIAAISDWISNGAQDD